jgi:hypothetical protein
VDGNCQVAGPARPERNRHAIPKFNGHIHLQMWRQGIEQLGQAGETRISHRRFL